MDIEYRDVDMDLLPSLTSSFILDHMMEREPNPAEGLTGTSFHAGISLPLLPSVLLAPFICVLCIRFTDLKWLVGHCEPHIIFASRSYHLILISS